MSIRWTGLNAGKSLIRQANFVNGCLTKWCSCRCPYRKAEVEWQVSVSVWLSSHPPDFLTGHMARRWPHTLCVSQSHLPWGCNFFDPLLQMSGCTKTPVWSAFWRNSLKNICDLICVTGTDASSHEISRISSKYLAHLLPHSFTLRSVFMVSTQAVQRARSTKCLHAIKTPITYTPIYSE